MTQEYDYQNRPNVAANVNKDPHVARYGRSGRGNAGSVSRSLTVTAKGNAALAADDEAQATKDGTASAVAVAFYKRQMARLDAEIPTLSAQVVMKQNEREDWHRKLQAARTERGE